LKIVVLDLGKRIAKVEVFFVFFTIKGIRRLEGQVEVALEVEKSPYIYPYD